MELLTSDPAALSRTYKDYAFLREEEKVAPFIKYLYTLSAVPFTCFTSSFPAIGRAEHDISQEPTEPGNTGPWLANNQSRDLNNEFWLL